MERLQSCSLKTRCVCEAAEQEQEQGFLRVHAVFGLVEDDGLRTVEHLVGDFGVAARGQAVHEHRVRLRFLHQGFVDLEGAEDGRALGGFMLHAHGDADIGIDSIGAFDGGLCVLRQTHFAAVGRGDFASLGDGETDAG